MTQLSKVAAISLLTFSVAACSGDPEVPEADTVTETRMDEVDVIDGTISDDMVDVDTQTTTDQPADAENAETDNEREDNSEAEE